MTVDLLTRLRPLYEEDRKAAAPTQVSDIVEPRRRVTEWKEELERKDGAAVADVARLAEKNATLRSKVERMRTVTTHLQSESSAVFKVMNEILSLCHKTNGAMTEVMNLKQWEL